MTDDSAFARQLAAADYSALCMRVLNLDAVLTAALPNEGDEIDDAQRKALAELGHSLQAEFGRIVEDIDLIEEVAQAEMSALLRLYRRASATFPTSPVPRVAYPSPWLEPAAINRASNIIRTSGPTEVAKLNDLVKWLSGRKKRPGADFPPQVIGALMVTAGCLFMILGQASGDPAALTATESYAVPLFSVGLVMMATGPAE